MRSHLLWSNKSHIRVKCPWQCLRPRPPASPVRTPRSCLHWNRCHSRVKVPTAMPSNQLSEVPSPSVESPSQPSQVPTAMPLVKPSGKASKVPSSLVEQVSHQSQVPTTMPSAKTSSQPSEDPLVMPSLEPSSQPSKSALGDAFESAQWGSTPFDVITVTAESSAHGDAFGQAFKKSQ